MLTTIIRTTSGKEYASSQWIAEHLFWSVYDELSDNLHGSKRFLTVKTLSREVVHLKIVNVESVQFLQSDG